MDETAKFRARNKRRGHLSEFTRVESSLQGMILANQPVDLIRESFHLLDLAFTKLITAHDDYCMFLDDGEYEEEEAWPNPVQTRFDRAKCQVKCYESKAHTLTQSADPSTPSPTSSRSKFKLQMQKAPLPTFSGGFIDYYPFKKDFEFLFRGDVDDSNTPLSDLLTVTEKREAVYLLKNGCLKGEALKWVEGESDFDSAWEILDINFGDPRLVSNAFLEQLEDLPSLKENDPKISLIFHLVKKANSVLSLVKLQKDLDNATMLSQLEKKFHRTDRTKWSEIQRRDSVEPNLANLMQFLKDEIWIRQKSGNTIVKRSIGSTNICETCVESDSDVVDMDVLLCGFTTASVQESKGKCWLCKSSDHRIVDCKQFLGLSPNDRLKAVRENNVCFFCVRNHRPRPCNKKREKCNEPNCPYYHHPLLHGATFTPASATPTTGDCNQISSGSNRLLPIVTVSAENSSKTKTVRANCLLDSGSQLTLIRDELAVQLNLEGEPIQLEITGVGGFTQKLQTKIFSVIVSSLNGDPPVEIQAIGVPKINQNCTEFDRPALAKLFDVSESKIHRDKGDVDILIGVNLPEVHVGPCQQVDNFVLRDSPLGLVIFGSPDLNVSGNCQVNHTRINPGPPDISRFWSIEDLGVTLNWCCQLRKRGEHLKTALEKRDEAQVRESAQKDGNRWRIPLPWKLDPSLLPDNYIQAKLKLESLEKRLSKTPKYAEKYNEQVQELVEAGSARILSAEELVAYHGPVHYMSHHVVLRPDKPTHPCRMVFNQAESFQGHKINDYLKKCGDQLNNLCGVLIRWREQPFVLFGDVRKMYHQIQTCEGIDQHTHRFLWRNFENREPDVYIKSVLTFGDISSPALANIAMDMTAEAFETQYPEATRAILQDRYMDDLSMSFSTIDELEKRKGEIDEILASGHFYIKEWISNAEAGGDENVKIEKVLGVLWDKRDDQLSIAMTIPEAITPSIVLTKRSLTGILAGVFDVFGFGAPIIISGKIGLQELWRQSFDWDSTLPEELEKRWIKWFEQLQLLKKAKFDRCISPKDGTNPELIIFCDSSKKAFGAVCYCRWTLPNGQFSTKFIMAKSRVAPLKTVSLPRLELQSAVLASRLYETVSIESRIQFKSVKIFTDSMITYSWIKNQESRLYKPYVATRIGEILTKSEPEFFGYCPSNDNAADVVSRGVPYSQLDGWIRGPDFLLKPESQWPTSYPDSSGNKDDPEVIKGQSMPTTTHTNPRFDLLDKFENWKKLIRVTAYVRRFINNFGNKYLPRLFSQRKDAELSVEELQSARETLVKLAQSDLTQEYDFGRKYGTLSPFIDDTGIIRVGGRLDNANVSYDEKHPALLPHDHPFSKLILRDVHQYGHPGPLATVAKVRKNYWIVGVRRIAKLETHRCMFCRKMRAKIETQFMAELPDKRVNPSPPFLHTACDLFGPMNVRVRPRVTTQVWGVIFTCLVTRAVYCDVIMDYSASEFIQTLRRFLCIHGKPQTMLSDRGSQLVKASQDIKVWCLGQEIEWTLVTPSAAHQNGCAESMVKCIKSALKTAIGDQTLTYMELQTVLFEAANLVNERPLGIHPNHPDDGSYISPNGLLMGRASDRVPQGPFTETKDPRRRVEFIQKIVDAWWRKWYQSVFPTLTIRKKWMVRNRDVQVGDIVLLQEPNPFRGKWTLARITQVFPGSDGVIRNVELKTVVGLYQRPITKIAMLFPVEEQS